MIGRHEIRLISRVLIFFAIILLLLILIVCILLTVFFMQGTSIPVIELDFGFSINQHFLRWYWDHFCDFWSDLSFLRWTQESVVLYISHVVMNFWWFDLFSRLVKYWLRLSFFELDSVSNGFDKEFSCELERILRSLNMLDEILPDLRRGIQKRLKAEHSWKGKIKEIENGLSDVYDLN